MPLDNTTDEDVGEFFFPTPPQSVPTTSTDPRMSSAALSDPTESLQEGEAQGGHEPGLSDEPLPEFDPRHKEAFEGLLFVGALTKDFEWFGHRFRIRTLNSDEVIEVGVITRDYVGTMSDIRAYTTAVVAACLISVDGRAMPQPISTDVADTPLRNRFDYVKRYFPLTIDAIYEQYLDLESTVAEVLAEMGKVSASVTPTPG
jgi:hypothetical protein